MWHDEQSVAGFIECLSIPQKLLAVNNLSLFHAAVLIPLYKYETATPCKVLDVNMLRRTCLFFCQIKISFILTR